MSLFGGTLRLIRKNRNMSIDEISKKTNVCSAMWEWAEGGLVCFDNKTICSICSFLSIDPQDLLDAR